MADLRRFDPSRTLPRSTYEQPVLRAARALLGCLLVRRVGGEISVGRIVEAEAYGGLCDASAHSYRGRTERCATMFGAVGHAYVYFSYGNHWCLNVIAGERDLATAVLLRAVEPVAGLDALRRRRAAATPSPARAEGLLAGRLDRELCNGPGKLAAAFAIDRRFDGHDLTRGEELWLTPGRPPRAVLWTPRIGLGTGPAAGWLWRVVDAESGAVGRIPATWPRAARPAPTLARARRESRPSR